MPPSVRGRRCGDGLRAALAAHIREKSNQARSTPGLANHKRHGNATDALAEFVQGLDLRDHRLVSVDVSNANRGGNRMEYRPGEEQERLLARLGLDDTAPAPGEALAELAEAAMEDLVAAANKRLVGEQEQASAALREVARLTVFRKRTLRAEAELDAAREHVAQLTATLAKERNEHEYMRLLVAPPDKAGAKPAKRTAKRITTPTNNAATTAEKE